MIGIVFGGAFLSGDITLKQYLGFMASSYLFKMVAALIDTGPFYILVAKLKRFLQIDQ